MTGVCFWKIEIPRCARNDSLITPNLKTARQRYIIALMEVAEAGPAFGSIGAARPHFMVGRAFEGKAQSRADAQGGLLAPA